MVLLPEEEKWLEEIWKRKNFQRMTFIELRSLYEWFKNRCRELGLDPKSFDFEMILDSSLDYYENKAKLEELLLGYSIPSKEIEELEYYKRLAEKYEKELEKLKKKKYDPKIDQVLNEIKKLKEDIRKMRDVYITKRELADVLRFFAEKIKDELNRIHRESLEMSEGGTKFETPPEKLTVEITIKQPVKDPFMVQSAENSIKIAEEIVNEIKLREPEWGRFFEEFLNRFKYLFDGLKELGYDMESQRTRLRAKNSLYTLKRAIDKFYEERKEEFPLTIRGLAVELKRIFDTIYGTLFRL